MKPEIVHNKNEEGFVIVFVLMILVVVSIIGISATDTSQTEHQIARNERLYKTLFYDADSGPYTTAKFVSRTIDDAGEQEASDFNLVFVDNADPPTAIATLRDDLYRQVMGFDDHDGGFKDLSFDNTSVDIKRDRTAHASGGATEFGSGDGGVGSGSKGGVQIFYNLDSDGTDNQSRSVKIIGTYRKIPDITGGL
jgi:hypothetical protein